MTGIVFGLFVLLHMIGNLKALPRPRRHSTTTRCGCAACSNRRSPYSSVLWVIWAVLLACLVGHVTCAYHPRGCRARAARGPFRRKGLPLRSFAARTMPVTGVVPAAVHHLPHPGPDHRNSSGGVRGLHADDRDTQLRLRQPGAQPRPSMGVRVLHRRRCCCWACTCRTACGSRSTTWARPAIGCGRCRLRVAGIVAIAVMVRQHLAADRRSHWSGVMTEFLLDDLRIIGSRVDGGVPDGDPATAWDRRKTSYRLVPPLNRRKFTVIVVGCRACRRRLRSSAGRAAASTWSASPTTTARARAAASPPRAASTRRGPERSTTTASCGSSKTPSRAGTSGPARPTASGWARRASRVIDHMNAIGAPFAREYGGQLATRSFGGVQVSRTYYTRGQTGQQLELAATQALSAPDRQGQRSPAHPPRDAGSDRQRRRGPRHCRP